MIPVYEIWSGVGEPTLSPGFNGRSQWVPAVWESDSDYEHVKLPLYWAKAYATELTKLSGLPKEVRGTGKHYRKVKASFEKVSA
jgi:hypothetical protein